jgi:hypothetical protein
VVSADYLEHFQMRVLQDALNEATASYWLRRADQFEEAKPTLADHRGQATTAELSVQWRELDRVARACRERAAVSPVPGISVEVIEAVREAA